MALSLLSRSELSKAVVSEDNHGIVVRYYRAQIAGHNQKWVLDRETRPVAPWHVVLDNTQAILDGPPRIHVGR